MENIVIVGAGIAGLTLALNLHAKGITPIIFEHASAINSLGVGINIQPYATEILSKIELLDIIKSRAIETKEMSFFNKYGQLIHTIPLGISAGFDFPQLSIHRGTLQEELLKATLKRLGNKSVITSMSLQSFVQTDESVEAIFSSENDGGKLFSVKCDALIGADGIHSTVYKCLFPDGPKLSYSGVNMWRGISAVEPFLSGATMVRMGIPSHGKIVIYPIENNFKNTELQLINWVAEINSDTYNTDVTNRPIKGGEFLSIYNDRIFDWLDVPNLISSSIRPILEFPMMDRDPLPNFCKGRVALVGDAAHPMVPVGSNGAGQAILDADALAKQIHTYKRDIKIALEAYNYERNSFVKNIVIGDRLGLPDLLISAVDERTGGMQFSEIDEILTKEELDSWALPQYQSLVNTD